jgi:predicted PurR-regulated permease PerM
MNEILFTFVWLIFAAVIVFIIFYALEKGRMPEPIKTVVTIGVVLIIVILCLFVLVNMVQRAGFL